MKEINNYNTTSNGCIGDLCLSKDDCYVGISQNATCVTNAEAEETAKMILKSLEATLFEKFNISFNREDNTEIVRILKNYVIDDQLAAFLLQNMFLIMPYYLDIIHTKSGNPLLVKYSIQQAIQTKMKQIFQIHA